MWIENDGKLGIIQIEVTDASPTFTVTTNSAGSGSSGSGEYKQGATVSISAGTPPQGQRFVNWTSGSPGVVFADATSPETTFVMPANAVTVTANFEQIQQGDNDGTGTGTGTGTGSTPSTSASATQPPLAEIPPILATPSYRPMAPVHAASTVVSAIKTANPLFLSGERTVFPAALILDWNWLKLRDFAALLSGTGKQFSVGYDESTRTISITTGNAYSPLGDELEDNLDDRFEAIASSQRLLVDGESVDVAAYNISGYNYFRLRDLAIILDIGVIYDETTREITLDLENPYTE